MCERIVIPARDEVERELSVNNAWWSFTTHFNVAASHSVPAALQQHACNATRAALVIGHVVRALLLFCASTHPSMIPTRWQSIRQSLCTKPTAFAVLGVLLRSNVDVSESSRF